MFVSNDSKRLIQRKIVKQLGEKLRFSVIPPPFFNSSIFLFIKATAMPIFSALAHILIEFHAWFQNSGKSTRPPFDGAFYRKFDNKLNRFKIITN